MSDLRPQPVPARAPGQTTQGIALPSGLFFIQRRSGQQTAVMGLVRNSLKTDATKVPMQAPGGQTTCGPRRELISREGVRKLWEPLNGGPGSLIIREERLQIVHQHAALETPMTSENRTFHGKYCSPPRLTP